MTLIAFFFGFIILNEELLPASRIINLTWFFDMILNLYILLINSWVSWFLAFLAFSFASGKLFFFSDWNFGRNVKIFGEDGRYDTVLFNEPFLKIVNVHLIKGILLFELVILVLQLFDFMLEWLEFLFVVGRKVLERSGYLGANGVQRVELKNVAFFVCPWRL